MNQTVPINSTAVFSCRVTGFLVWVINTTQIRNDVQRDAFCSDHGVCVNGVNGTLDISPDVTESVLLVAANENNGSNITCLASETITSASEESKVVVLKTFGKLVHVCSAYERACL